jgi:nucleoside 2-deoxyribosyltransferase
MDTTRPKPFCFILMPFDDVFSDIYLLGIKTACTDAGGYCERVDEQIFEERILDRIFNQIAKADIVIADMTGKNPNVFYEVGYAHAIGKTTILLTQKAEDIPFDLKHFPHIIYNNKITELKEELYKRVKWFLENPSVKAEEKLAIDIFCDQTDLSANEVHLTALLNIHDQGAKEISLMIHNNSGTTFYSGDFKIGLITSSNFDAVFLKNSTSLTKIVLPDNQHLFMLSNYDTLFPSLFSDSKLVMRFSAPSTTENIIVRLFTSIGTRDYSFKINFKK